MTKTEMTETKTEQKAVRARPQRVAKTELPAKFMLGIMAVANKHKADIRFSRTGQILGHSKMLGASGVIYNPACVANGVWTDCAEQWSAEVLKLFPTGAVIAGAAGVDATRVFKAYCNIANDDSATAHIDVSNGNIIIKGNSAVSGRGITVKSAFLNECKVDVVVEMDGGPSPVAHHNDDNTLRVLHNLALQSKLPGWDRIMLAEFDGRKFFVSGNGRVVVASRVDIGFDDVSVNPRLVDVAGVKGYMQNPSRDANGNVTNIMQYYLTDDNVLLVENCLATNPPKLENALSGSENDIALLNRDVLATLLDEVKLTVPGFGAVGAHYMMLNHKIAKVFAGNGDIVAEISLPEYDVDFAVNVDPVYLMTMAKLNVDLNVINDSGSGTLRYVDENIMVAVVSMRLS